MKKGKILLVMLAILLALGMVMGCGDLGNKEPTNPVTPGGDDEEDFYEDVVSKYIGVYETKYGTITETIKFGQNFFNISDSDNDELKFTITEWVDADEKDIVALEGFDTKDYTIVFKFIGKIMSSMTKTNTDNPVPDDAGGSHYLSSTFTAPGFTQADVKADGTGPDAWMYLYLNVAGDNPEFVRTSFISDAHKNPAKIVQKSSTDKAARIYKFKNK